MIRGIALLSLAAVVVGCGSSPNPNNPPAHTAEEEAAIRSAQGLTPQQQLEQAEKSPLPADQKAALVNSIKEKHGL